MSNVKQLTALQLKRAGMPQPTASEIKPGQVWYLNGVGTVNGKGMPVIINYVNSHEDKVFFSSIGVSPQNKEQVGMSLMVGIFANNGVFAPSLDYIAQSLPEGFILQMWDGRHSCKIETEETTIRTQADSFAEAAALVYLELQKNAPNPDVSEPGGA